MRQRNIKNKQEIIKNSKNYLENPKEYKRNWHKLFNNSNPIHVEIGSGKGNFIIESAKRNPNINYIGIEKQESILALAIKKIEENIPNLYLIRFDAFNIQDIFDKEITTLYLNFSDPWPKKRHAKRRLTSEIFLDKYEQIFQRNNHIIMKTDNKDLFCYSIKTLNNQGYYIEYLTFDLKKENDLNNILTEYEEKFTKLNNPIYKIEVIKKKK